MEPKALLAEAQKGGFWSYIAGVAYQVLTNYHVRGLVIDNYKTDLPMKKGLSSSAAICVLAARAFNRVYDLKMTVRGEMELAYQGEITTPSRCGRMDQGCAFGNRPVLMTFDGDRSTPASCTSRQRAVLRHRRPAGAEGHHGDPDRLNRCYPFAENEIGAGRAGAARPDQQAHRAPGDRRARSRRRRAARRPDDARPRPSSTATPPRPARRS